MSSHKKKSTGRKILAAGAILSAIGFALFGMSSCVSAIENMPEVTTIEEPTSQPTGGVKVDTEMAQARTAAESYINGIGGFSYQGLIDQLSSEYGNQFPEGVAKKAVDSMDIDWDEQAVISAESYLALETGFSRQGLIDQLTSEYGGKFTIEQATHAADAVGF